MSSALPTWCAPPPTPCRVVSPRLSTPAPPHHLRLLSCRGGREILLGAPKDICRRVRGRGMSEFARNTPPDVAKLLRARLVAMPDHTILRALATHVSMGDLWTELGKLG